MFKKIEEIIAEPLAAKGYEIVRIIITGQVRRVLQIMIENQDGRPISLEDCETASRLVSILLDQHDPIKSSYNLEISSTGLDRPLVKPKDYQRFINHKVVIRTHVAIENRKTFNGHITAADENDVTLMINQDSEEPKNLITIPLSNIKSARLFVNLNAN